MAQRQIVRAQGTLAMTNASGHIYCMDTGEGLKHCRSCPSRKQYTRSGHQPA